MGAKSSHPRSAREAGYRRLGRVFGRVFVRLILKRVPVVVAFSVDLEEKKTHVYIGIWRHHLQTIMLEGNQDAL